MTLAQTDILDRVSKLYRKYGIRSVTMNDIASELGISKKTLYQHISDKEALVDKVLEADFSRMKRALEVAISQIKQPIQQFIEIQNIILTFLSEQSVVTGFELKKYYSDKYHYYFDKYISLFISVLDQNLSKGIDLGIYRENLDATLIVKTHVASLISVIDNDLIKIQEYLSEKHSIESLRYHLRAIVNKKHIDTIDNYLETIKPVLS